MHETVSVLFVDDEPSILKSIARVLSTTPIEVLTRGSAQEALALLESRPIDVLVSDIEMPEMTGLELMKIVRRDYPRMIRMLLTGNTTTEAALTAINEGEVLRFFTKPFNPPLFEQTMVGLAERVKRLRSDGEEGSRRARTAELCRWVEERFPGATAIERDANGAVVVDVQALTDSLQAADLRDALDLLD